MPIRSAAARTASLALTAGLALAVLTGCGDDAEDADSANSSAGGSSSTSSSSPAAEETAPADPAAAQADVEENYKIFFETGDPELLEDGEQLTEAIARLGGMAASKSATVTAVTFTGSDSADVTYDLIVDGAPALPGATGTAVLVDDTWKVSKDTFCTLSTLASGGAPAAGCS